MTIAIIANVDNNNNDSSNGNANKKTHTDLQPAIRQIAQCPNLTVLNFVTTHRVVVTWLHEELLALRPGA